MKYRYAKVFFTENHNNTPRRGGGGIRREPPKKQSIFGEPLPDRGAARIGGEENRRNRKKKVFIIIIFCVFQPQNTKRGRLIAYNIGEVFKRPLISFYIVKLILCPVGTFRLRRVRECLLSLGSCGSRVRGSADGARRCRSRICIRILWLCGTGGIRSL